MIDKILVPALILAVVLFTAGFIIKAREHAACNERGGVYLYQAGCVKLESLPQ